MKKFLARALLVASLIAGTTFMATSPASAALNPNNCSKAVSGKSVHAYCAPVGDAGFYKAVAKCEGWTINAGPYVTYVYGKLTAPGGTSKATCGSQERVTWSSISFT